MTDSSTGGYLLPALTPAPLEGQALNRFLQQWVVGITGMDGTLVRPRWQAEPPTIPNAATAWCAIGIVSRRPETFPYLRHNADGSDTLIRHERLVILASFFDTGVSGQADALCEQFFNGAMVPQNLEPLTLADMGIVETSEPTAVPTLLKERWLYQVDLQIVIVRQLTRDYPVLSLLSSQGTLTTDTGQTRDISVSGP